MAQRRERVKIPTNGPPKEPAKEIPPQQPEPVEEPQATEPTRNSEPVKVTDNNTRRQRVTIPTGNPGKPKKPTEPVEEITPVIVPVKPEPEPEPAQPRNDNNDLILPDKGLEITEDSVAGQHWQRQEQIDKLTQVSGSLAIYANILSAKVETLQNELAKQMSQTVAWSEKYKESNRLLNESGLKLADKEDEILGVQQELANARDINRQLREDIKKHDANVGLLAEEKNAESERSSALRVEMSELRLKLDKAEKEAKKEKGVSEQLRKENDTQEATIARLRTRLATRNPGKGNQGFYESEPLSLDSTVMHQQMGAVLNKLSFKGRHNMEIRMNDSVITIPHIHMTSNPLTREPCYAVRFDKNTKRRYEGASLRKDTLDSYGHMQVLLRDDQGVVVEDAHFDYSVNAQEGQRTYLINAGRVNVYMNDIGEGTFRLKTIVVNTL